MTDRKKIGRNNRARGAGAEREAAALLTELTGEEHWRNIDRGGKWGDVQSATHVYEIKSRQVALPQLFDSALAQMKVAAEHTGKSGGVLVRYARPGRKARWLLIEEVG